MFGFIWVSFAVLGVMALDNGLGRTPVLGWSSWNRYYNDVSDELIRATARALVSTNLSRLGFTSVHIDAGWLLHSRDAAGNLQIDPVKFPHGIGAVADYVHSLGLTLGGYTDLARGSCGPGPGSLGYYDKDAQWFATVAKLDYLKVDFCGEGITPGGDDELQHWGALAAALNRTGRPIFYSICTKTAVAANATGADTPYRGQVIYAPPPEWTAAQKANVSNSWLVEYGNTVDEYYSAKSGPHACRDATAPCGIITNIDSIVARGKLWEGAPGGVVDADMLEVCQFNGTHNGPSLTAGETRMHFYLWALFPSPLILGFDVVNITTHAAGRECLALISNEEVIAVNQDPKVEGARLLRYEGSDYNHSTNPTPAITTMVWGRRLATAARAVVLVNRGPVAAVCEIVWAELGLPEGTHVFARDIGRRHDVGMVAGPQWAVSVPPHDAIMLTLTPVG